MSWRVMGLMLLLIHSSRMLCGQQLVHSDFEKGDFNHLKLDFIGRYGDRILVYKGKMTGSAFMGINNRIQVQRNPYSSGEGFNSGNIVSEPVLYPIEMSKIDIYDPRMKLISEIDLPLPKEITGTVFMTYEDSFIMFYQYADHGISYCMAARFDTAGRMQGDPVILDQTRKIKGIKFESQIYTVLHSEDKQHIVAFKMAYYRDSGYVLTSLDFDHELKLRYRYHGKISSQNPLNFNEYGLDNEGNLLFLGIPTIPENLLEIPDSYFFALHQKEERIQILPLATPGIFKECPRLVIDNKNKSYSLISFFKSGAEGDVKGLKVMKYNIDGDSISADASTLLSHFDVDSSLNAGDSFFDDFYISDIFLRTNGGLLMVSRQFYSPYSPHAYDRWNYLRFFREMVNDDFFYYDPYSFDHNYPWRLWHYFYNESSIYSEYLSSYTLFVSFSPSGEGEWAKTVETEQSNRFYLSIGSKCAITSANVYLIYNKQIKGHPYLMAETINPSGEIDADRPSRSEMAVGNANRELDYFPMLGRQISSSEFIMPCKQGGKFCIAKLDF